MLSKTGPAKGDWETSSPEGQVCSGGRTSERPAESSRLGHPSQDQPQKHREADSVARALNIFA